MTDNSPRPAQRTQLSRIQIHGLRSLRDVDLRLGSVNVLIGPNGAGKSSLLTALRLPSLIRSGQFASFVARAGGASRLLHYGPKTTPELRLAYSFAAGNTRRGYEAVLQYASGDHLFFHAESLVAGTVDDERHDTTTSVGLERSSILADPQGPNGANEQQAALLTELQTLMGGLQFYHFHDTSPLSPLRQNAVLADARTLRSDGANLAAYLYRLRRGTTDDMRAAWRLLEGLVQRVAPFVRSLEPELTDESLGAASTVRLYWQDTHGYRFDVHDLSDGTLRAIALFAALTQPPDARPAFIAIDEPELGLHPAAISILAGLVRSAAAHTQVLLATQSPALLDEFAAEEVIVAEQKGGGSSFRRLNPAELASWLEDYSLSQLYDKNLLGGRP